MLRRTFIAASVGSVAGALASCTRSPPPVASATPDEDELVTGAALAFGTTMSIAVIHPDREQAELAIAAAFHEAKRVESLMSIYDERSQVFQLNRDGVLPHPDRHLLAVLAQARALSALTRGAFDITVQPLWSLCSKAGASLPPSAERLKAQSHVNWERVDASPEQVILLKPGMQITLNGLAQGYAADLATAALKARGIAHTLIDTGEFSASGNKPGHLPWTLGVQDPREHDRIVAKLRLDGRCAATSGDYASAFTPDFVHHHIVDPATGYSPQELASVTVLAPNAMLADGLSTAFMVMGAKKAHALAARQPGVDLLSINKRGIVWKSPNFPSLS